MTASTTSVSTTTTVASTSTTSGATQDLRVTTQVRQSLLQAAAKFHQLPAADYTGLRAGETYYAFDPANQRYYAAAGLIPSPTSLNAQIGTQDDGAYNLFTRAMGTTAWTVYSDGLGGVQGTTCPLKIPPSVLSVWNWKVNTCYPPS